MKLDKYVLRAERDFTVFKFVSIGPKGRISKIIQFEYTDEPGLYNLAFGDKDQKTGGFSDLITSNNGDSEKVLATVVAAIYVFFDKYPDAIIYATGSTIARTRLYRMGITKYYDQVIADFQLFGRVGDQLFEFEIGKEYDGFLAKRKFCKLQYHEKGRNI